MPDVSFRVNLDVFEGPLDLLLHLIRKQDLDIWDIPIAAITEEYLRTLELMSELNLDVAGEFLVMAATLTAIKSHMLLPKDGGAALDAIDDPRAELVERLLEYQRFKAAAEELMGGRVLYRDVFERGQSALNLPEEEPPLPDVQLYDLLDALQDVLSRARSRGFVHQVTAERFSVVERIHWLHDLLVTEGATGFRALFSSFRARMDVILTFLALLEMLKASIVKLEAVEEHLVTEGGEEEARTVDFLIVEREPGAELDMDWEEID